MSKLRSRNLSLSDLPDLFRVSVQKKSKITFRLLIQSTREWEKVSAVEADPSSAMQHG